MPPRRLRRMMRTGATALGWVLLVPGMLGTVVLLVLRLFPELHTWHHYVIAAATFIPLLWIPVLVACLGLLLVLRSRWRLLGAVVLIAAITVFTWPLLPAPERSDVPVAVGKQITVLSLNVQFGRADVKEIARLAGPAVDAIALQEFTPPFKDALAAAGLFDEFPYRAGTARGGAGGSTILSRTPVEIVAQTEHTRSVNLIARTTIEGTIWHLGVVHSAAPQLGAAAWTEDAAAIGMLAAPFLEENLLLVGDYNAIDQHFTMRELTADGDLRDLAARRQGEGLGWHPTWPADAQLPPFAQIDHALVSGSVIGGVPEYATVTGTDHRALLVEVAAVQ